MNKILITGITGFVGSNLYKYLIRNEIDSLFGVFRNRNQVSGLQRLEGKFEYNNLFRDPVAKFNVYIHLAGKAHDVKNTSNEEEYFKVNYELTKRLFNQFANDPVAEDFIFISTVKAVSDSPEGILDEEVSPEPVTAYGKSKLKAEQYVLDSCPEGKKVHVLRPCMIHGPGNQGNLNLLYSMINSGLPWPLGAYDNSRSFLSIENFCFVIKEILNDKLDSGVYNIADDEALSTSELVSLIGGVTNKKLRIWNVPKIIIKSAAKLGNYIPLPLNEDRLEKLTESFLVSNAKLKGALEIAQLPVSAKEGMRKTLQSFQAS